MPLQGFFGSEKGGKPSDKDMRTAKSGSTPVPPPVVQATQPERKPALPPVPPVTEWSEIKEPEAALPEFRPVQIFKSKDKVLDISIKDREITRPPGIVVPVGENTLTIPNQSEFFGFLDRNGVNVGSQNSNAATFIHDWSRELTPNGSSTYPNVVCKEPSKLPGRFSEVRELRNYSNILSLDLVKKIIDIAGEDDNYAFTPPSYQTIDTQQLGKLLVDTARPGLVVIFDRENKSFIAYQTKDDQGTNLPPNSWKRFDYTDWIKGRCPVEVKAEVSLLRQKDVTGINYLKNGNFVFSFKDRLEVRPTQEGEGSFYDSLAGVNGNITEDPTNSGVIYYCLASGANEIIRLDTNKPFKGLKSDAVALPKEYGLITNLSLDPTGNFLTFQSIGEFVVLAKDTLQEIGKIPKLFEGKLDDQGKIRGVDGEGRLVVYDANFQEISQALEKRRVARLAKGLTADLFKGNETVIAVDEAEKFSPYIPLREDTEKRFSAELQTIKDLDRIAGVFSELEKFRAGLRAKGLSQDQVVFITKGVTNSIYARQYALAAPVIAQGIDGMAAKLGGSLTMAGITEAQADLAKLKAMEGLTDDTTRVKIRDLEKRLGTQSAEFYKGETTTIQKSMDGLLTGVKAQLDEISSLPDLADWIDVDLARYVGNLAAMANNCPPEAVEAHLAITNARRQLQALSREYETRFKEQYAAVREKASEVMGERVSLMKEDLDGITDRFRSRGFKTRADAEMYLNSSESLGALREEIAGLAAKNPEAAKLLDRDLKARMAILLSEAERGGLTKVAETGQQMITFGRNTLFPRWEARVKEKVQRQVDLVFIPNEASTGPGVHPAEIYGDVGILETNSHGKTVRKRLYEGMPDENDWRLGAVSWRGVDVFPSYVTQADYRKIKQDFSNWNKGDASTIRKGIAENREALKNLYKSRAKPKDRDAEKDALWKAKYQEKLSEYAQFRAEHHVSILSRVDQIRNAPETEFTNGSGYVPDWSSHWVVDETTEDILEKIAQTANMQLALKEGLLMLKGHAGTGKDVAVKMFANRTNRPYFAYDGTKWTTDTDLSEDIVLEDMSTIKVPSVVLNAITTPGGIMYFNEWNAMPEQAQLFLHSLMDEKRSITLKTRSGQVVRAASGVLLMGSMNPGYPGTFEPQFATKSRMVQIEVNYPPLYREKDPTDRNPNPPLSAAEALRVARGVDSFADLTYETNLAHNEFVQLWDRHINGLNTGAPDLTAVQKFDLEAVLTMVQFAAKLREGFVLKFEKNRASSLPKGTLLVGQPITGREMRRMAYVLNQMTPEEKATANPEAKVRELIDQFFISHIDKKEEQEDIRNAMATWTSSKRPAP